MQKTLIQKLVFSSMMAVVMVYGMEVYNETLRLACLSCRIFCISFIEMICLSLCVLLLQSFIAEPCAKRLSALSGRFLPGKPALLFSLMMVVFMCPMMSFVVTVVLKAPDNIYQLLNLWRVTILINLPMALAWQLLVAGPAVKFTYGKIYQVQRKEFTPARPAQLCCLAKLLSGKRF